MTNSLPGVPTPEPVLPSLLVNQQRAAQALDVCERTVYELRRRGILPAVKIGDAVRYRWSDLEAFAASNGAPLDPSAKGGQRP